MFEMAKWLEWLLPGKCSNSLVDFIRPVRMGIGMWQPCWTQ